MNLVGGTDAAETERLCAALKTPTATRIWPHPGCHPVGAEQAHRCPRNPTARRRDARAFNHPKKENQACRQLSQVIARSSTRTAGYTGSARPTKNCLVDPAPG